MNHFSTLPNTSRIPAAFLLVFGLSGAGAQTSRAGDHSLEYNAMSMKDDLAHRSTDIHWPTGFEPEKADLFACLRTRSRALPPRPIRDRN
jgi:hypothetical protein